ncbi:MAG: copper transporter [Micrococcales bacterium]|nr:copper transporter [Micrococcales bacterium]
MIDFRYHIVSLISVFLALAVGVVLGAGPLEQTIGDSLSTQINRLTDEKSALETKLATANRGLGDEKAFVDQAAAELLADRLTGHRVAIINLGAVPDETARAVEGRLLQAGAEVTAQVTVKDAWTNPDSVTYRKQLAATLAGHLNPAPVNATTDVTLAASLVQALTGADPASPGRFSDSAATLMGILTTSDNALVAKAGDVTGPADSLVVITPPAKGGAPTDAVVTARLAVVGAAAGSQPTVLVDGARGKASLIDAVFADPALKNKVTTVSGIAATSAQVTVPMALAAQIGGIVDHYGHGDGEKVLPPTVRPEPAEPEVEE